MTGIKNSSLMVVALMVALFLFCSVSAQAQQQPSLSNEDCVKCHTAPPADLAAAGKKHKEVGCTGCHVGHPPTVKKPIPQCNDCHGGMPHFDLKGCLGCHKVGENGNTLGPNLTEVGSRLGKDAIARTLVNPTPPMPPYRALQKDNPEQFDQLVQYVASLRGD